MCKVTECRPQHARSLNAALPRRWNTQLAVGIAWGWRRWLRLLLLSALLLSALLIEKVTHVLKQGFEDIQRLRWRRWRRDRRIICGVERLWWE